jgi:hypothetical protein
MFTNAGGPHQGAPLAVHQANAVSRISFGQKQLKGCKLFNIKAGDQPSGGTIVKGKATHGVMRWMREAITPAVVYNVVIPLFKDVFPIGIAISIALMNLVSRGIRCEVTRAFKGLHDFARRLVTRPASMPFTQMMAPKIGPISPGC